MTKRLFTLLFVFLFELAAFSQTESTSQIADTSKQVDLFDLLGRISPKLDIDQEDSIPKEIGVLHFSGLPVIGYALQTGMVGGLTGNIAYYTDTIPHANISNIMGTVAYTQQKQTIVILQPSHWTSGNRYNIFGDIVYLKFPQETFGLGGNSSRLKPDPIDYSYFRFYSTINRHLKHDIFLGLGYNLDYHWNIKERPIASVSSVDFENYGFSSTTISSGVTASFLFDNRRNMINPQKGFYASIVYRFNSTVLHSDHDWHSLLMDFRKYVHPSRRSQNVLAFWSYTWLTFNSAAPYLDLPSCGWDNYGNTGRGYIQGRFRGKNMVYLESEYRFKVTKNGLLGGVVFVNAQSFTDYPSNRFSTVSPGYGFGVRIKVNRNSGTNVALDYGFGREGSRGLFVNLCEMF